MVWIELLIYDVKADQWREPELIYWYHALAEASVNRKALFPVTSENQQPDDTVILDNRILVVKTKIKTTSPRSNQRR